MANHRKDKSESPIWEALEKAGFKVWDTLPCDLLTWRPDKGWRPLECKTPYNADGSQQKRKDQESQVEFLQLTGTPIVLTPEQALRALGAL